MDIDGLQIEITENTGRCAFRVPGKPEKGYRWAGEILAGG